MSQNEKIIFVESPHTSEELKLAFSFGLFVVFLRKKLAQILRTVLGWNRKTFGSENVNITYLDIFCVCFFKTNKTKH